MKNVSFRTKLLTISCMLTTSALFPVKRSEAQKSIRYTQQYLQEISSELNKPEINAPLIEAYIREARNIQISQYHPGKCQKARFRALRSKLNKHEVRLQRAESTNQR